MDSMNRALIFDVDGTLADTERHGHRVAFNLAFAHCGLEWSWGEALYGKLLAISGGKQRIRHYIDHYHPPVSDQFRGKEGLDELVSRVHAEKTRRYVDLAKRGEIPFRPGVLRLINESAEAGFRLAIATTTSRQSIEALLQSVPERDLFSRFEVIATADEVGRLKPHPDLYDHVLDAMEVSPDQVVAIEDSENGLLAALSAGIRTLVTVNSYTEGSDFQGAMAVVDHLGEPGNPCLLLGGDGTSFGECVRARDLVGWLDRENNRH